ncbi:MAG: hypothetical protein A2Z21_07060 [Candidatus Fraserbacteria bacterium RBG_16_55_9]|uniref:Uncharacterized protein n=1 Tax=Fraserbacteria sp. (strain RBG_16_55_9) TaxID=1817864 RepID=A0A1F5UTG7_FRAXR|nr:MAG: hypothetical protein A2Z21_07060 [Candidatus Fraserbacteria bacterium RBG_16_55_9]
MKKLSTVERISKERIVSVAILAIVLVGKAITVSAGASQTPYRVEIFMLTAEDGVTTDGFATGIRFYPSGDQDSQKVTELTARLTEALHERITEFVSLELVRVKNGNPTQALLFVARFTEQVSLEQIAKAVTPVFEEFARAQIRVGFGNGSLAKLTEE